MGSVRIAAAWAVSLALLAGCGGGGGGGTAGTPSQPVAGTVTGVAATGAALAGAAIRLTDSTGTVVASATAGADGSYTLDIPASAIAPLVASATKDDVVLYSPLATGATQRVNITPLTHVAAAQLSPTGDPSALGAQLKAGSASFGADKVKLVVAALLQALQPLLANAGADGVDPISGSFAADGTGHDRLLAAISVTVTPAASGPATITISVRGVAAGADEAAAITFTAGSTPPKLPNSAATAALPPAHADALVAGWVSRANACWALARTDRVTGTALSDTVKASACRTLFWNDDPATYRHNGLGVNALGAFNGLYSDGATGQQVDSGRLEFVESDGSLLVAWRETTVAGSVFHARTWFRVQDGSLKLYGNQGAYTFTVRATAQRRDYIRTPSLEYVVTGFNIFVSNFNDGQSSLFDRVVVTAPGGRQVTLRPLPGLSFLAIERPDHVQTGTTLMRLAARFTSASTRGTPRQVGEQEQVWTPNPAGDATDWTEAEIAALPEVSRWKAAFFLAGNTGSTPDAVQTTVATARPVLPSMLLSRPWATLTTAYRESLAAASTEGSLALAEGGSFLAFAAGPGTGWQVPPGALSPQLIQAFGFTQTAGLPRWNDFANVATTARAGTISCSRQLASDAHCAPGGGYSLSARIDVLQLSAGDAQERDFQSLTVLFPATPPPN